MFEISLTINNCNNNLEHWPGFYLAGLRAFLGFLFFLGITNTLSVNNNGDTVSFLRVIRILGLVWFLSFPVIINIATCK